MLENNNINKFIRTKRRLIDAFCVMIFLSISVFPAQLIIPTTGRVKSGLNYVSSPLESENAFIEDLTNGKPEEIVGLWLPGLAGLVVEKQAEGEPGYVSEKTNNVTRFQLADKFGSIGLLAHAHKAGTIFHKLITGQIVTLIYGDGSTVGFKIDEIRLYQALDPADPHTGFKSLLPGGASISQEELFYEIYDQPGRLVLQTCIINDNNNLWGRKFIIATKLQ